MGSVVPIKVDIRFDSNIASKFNMIHIAHVAKR